MEEKEIHRITLRYTKGAEVCLSDEYNPLCGKFPHRGYDVVDVEVEDVFGEDEMLIMRIYLKAGSAASALRRGAVRFMEWLESANGGEKYYPDDELRTIRNSLKREAAWAVLSAEDEEEQLRELEVQPLRRSVL